MRSPAWTTTLSPTTLRPELVQDGGAADAGAAGGLIGGAEACQANAGDGPSGVTTTSEGVGRVPVSAPSASRTSARPTSGRRWRGCRRGGAGERGEGVGRDGGAGIMAVSRFAQRTEEARGSRPDDAGGAEREAQAEHERVVGGDGASELEGVTQQGEQQHGEAEQGGQQAQRLGGREQRQRGAGDERDGSGCAEGAGDQADRPSDVRGRGGRWVLRAGGAPLDTGHDGGGEGVGGGGYGTHGRRELGKATPFLFTAGLAHERREGQAARDERAAERQLNQPGARGGGGLAQGGGESGEHRAQHQHDM